MTAATFTSLAVAVGADGVAELTLTRPDVMNRFDDLLHVELTAAVQELRANPDVRAVVLASTGKVFSAGGDFDLMREANADVATRLRIVDDGRRLLGALLDLPQPLVVALHGAAIGLGATVVLASDAVVAARAATLADPHVALGLVAGDGGCLVWPQAVGMLRARRHLLTGDPIDAERAYAMGLVTDLVDTPDDALPAARALAGRMAALPPLAVQGTKRALNRVTQQRAGEVVDLAFAHEETTLASDDLLEAITAFQERRPGVFRGT
ncbi:Short-chain-enoyl-CoA hydratase [Paraconexibacter sp. AEG42_29]|uniref:Short-chain-enoyl-CoA hydratase n=1 Tax=Paraconexibacter sp. AEG42_29 TaxID=2997339 RepID=A0AAU7B4K6_9ACTN